jgi:hypothetical protein
MNEQQLAELKRIKTILSAVTGLEDDDQEYIEDARKALQSIISQDALDKMAENARELGLDYEGEIKTKVKEDDNGSFTITDAHSTADVVRWLLTQDTKETILCLIDEESQPAPMQGLPFGVGGGLVAIKTLLSRDPCAHAKVAIEMIDAILKEHTAAQPASEEDMKVYRAIADNYRKDLAAAQPAPWVNLTDEEILETLDLIGYDSQAFAQAYSIEAKLKEKNSK